MPSEKREQERFFLELEAKVSFRHSAEESPTIETAAANISSGGAFLQTQHKLPMASKVQIEFHLNFDDLKKLKFILSMDSLRKLTGKKVWVTTTGIVIRQEETGVGVIFDTDYQLTPMKPTNGEK